MTLDDYLDALASRASTETVTNQYAGPAGARRRANLRVYLQRAAVHRPVALVGEAPGYRGCAVTGIPLTTRRLLAGDIGGWGVFADAPFDTGEALGPWTTESSATVVWRHVPAVLAGPPLLVNAFPFHPHPPRVGAGNRGLTAAELAEGAAWLRRFLSLFPRAGVVAVGRQAERALSLAGTRPTFVLRHPSHGGAVAFASGLRAVGAGLRGAGEERGARGDQGHAADGGAARRVATVPA